MNLAHAVQPIADVAGVAVEEEKASRSGAANVPPVESNSVFGLEGERLARQAVVGRLRREVPRREVEKPLLHRCLILSDPAPVKPRKGEP